MFLLHDFKDREQIIGSSKEVTLHEQTSAA
jgi:hypothetical protein